MVPRPAPRVSPSPRNALGSRIGLGASQLTLQASLLQFAMALSVNLELSASEYILRFYVTDRTVQADVVIAIPTLLYQALCIFQHRLFRDRVKLQGSCCN